MNKNIDKIKLIITNIILMVYIYVVSWFLDELFVYFWILCFLPLFIVPILYIYMFIKSICLIKEEVSTFLNYIPLLTLILIIIIWIFLNPIDLRMRYEFKKYFNERNSIVNKIQNGKKYKLDEKYKNLSCDGRVNIYLNNEKEVLVGFCYSLSMTGESSYFIYSSKDEELIKKNIKLIERIELIDNNWYYVQLQ